MPLRAALNEFRRIGRGFLRIAHQHRLEVVAIDDIVDPEMLAYMLRLGPAYGPAMIEVTSEPDSLNANRQIIAVAGAEESARGMAVST